MTTDIDVDWSSSPILYRFKITFIPSFGGAFINLSAFLLVFWRTCIFLYYLSPFRSSVHPSNNDFSGITVCFSAQSVWHISNIGPTFTVSIQGSISFLWKTLNRFSLAIDFCTTVVSAPSLIYVSFALREIQASRWLVFKMAKSHPVPKWNVMLLSGSGMLSPSIWICWPGWNLPGKS